MLFSTFSPFVFFFFFFFYSFTLQWLQRPDIPVQVRGRYQTTVFEDRLFVGSAVSAEEDWLSVIFFTIDLEHWHEVNPPPCTIWVHGLFSHGGHLHCAASSKRELDRSLPSRHLPANRSLHGYLGVGEKRSSSSPTV